MQLTKLVITGCSVLMAANLAVGGTNTVWQYGTARARITPDRLFWMGGFAARTRPAEGTLDDLWAKVLVLQPRDGDMCVLVTVDLLGIPKWLYDGLCLELERRHGIRRSQVLFACSHTHSGPVIRDALQDIYPLDDQQRSLISQYSDKLQQILLETIEKALSRRNSARLFAGQGQAKFALNRRTNNEGKLPEILSRGESPKGPSDFAVPVLAGRSDDGQLQAVVFGYAAHTSALTDNYKWSGDYAGVAQRIMEARHPGAVAMFVQGCGSDQSAAPRGTVELCQKLGQQLATAVESVLESPMKPVLSRTRTAFEFVSLDFGEQPTLTELEELGKGTGYRARWARRLARELSSGKTFPHGYPEYPVLVWQIGTGLSWVALGGEVCVDYALRFKREFGDSSWVIGYANDVMAYIPSRRLWEEGGYQAGAFDVYGLPANRWCADIENRIADAVSRMRSSLK